MKSKNKILLYLWRQIVLLISFYSWLFRSGFYKLRNWHPISTSPSHAFLNSSVLVVFAMVEKFEKFNSSLLMVKKFEKANSSFFSSTIHEHSAEQKETSAVAFHY